MEGRALFLDARPGASPDGGGWAGSPGGLRLEFGAPLALRRAETLDGVRGVVDWAEAEARAGRYAVLALAYEAAPAFDCALCAHEPQDGLPLAWAASHLAPLPALPLCGPHAEVPAPGPWRALVPPSRYAANFARLQAEIGDGETYQANYTVPFECSFAPAGADAGRAWFARLARAQAGGFCAWLDLGRHLALSLSPELFFRLEGGELLARPMKGTAPRGGAPGEDAALRAELAQSPKNRAENVMIVDLLRSDLGRVAKAGSVRVSRLFQVEDYPTVFQMTSEVRATLKDGAGLADILAAVFPCGSVTGAPKVRTMQLLRELEPHPRGLYCGAIGLLEPGSASGPGRMTFSVPIRTLVLDRDTGLVRFGVGGGVTHDSRPEAEYAECLTKMRFLVPPGEDFALLESLLLLRGRFPLLQGHLERLARSAERFGFALDGAAVRRALAELATAHSAGRFKARLALGRDGALATEAVAIAGGRMQPLRLGFAQEPVDSRDELLGHKTTRRAVYEAALAACPGCDDVLLVNERGEVTESTRASLVLRLDGELVTPQLSSGLLPGVFREGLVRRGIVRERALFPADVLRAERVWLVNSVRWWMRCEVAGRGSSPAL
ncbi:MAG: chorismate-binding protein [Proteobacteria bacterium]|nr:chorismate-binding protein [Pseudomonadota bacterium]MBU1594458.1 chorismate-binding protein [Pseudomonadota bacterium]